MKVKPSVYASMFALSTVSLACGAQAQAPDVLQSVSAPTSGQAQAHPHKDSSSMVVIGLLAGGAALMAGGGHGSSGSSEGAMPQVQALHPQISQPQVLITGGLPHPAMINGVLAASSVPTGTSFGKTAANDKAKPVAVFTLPVESPASLAAAVPQLPAAEMDPADATIDGAAMIDAAAPTQALAPFSLMPSLPSAPAPSVPEPSASLALAIGSFGLAGLLLGARRRSIS